MRDQGALQTTFKPGFVLQPVLVFLDVERTRVMLMFIVPDALLFAHVLTAECIPQTVAEHSLAAGMAAWMFLMVANIILRVAGNFMEPTGIFLILAPISFPVATQLGIAMVADMEIDMITPPMVLYLFVNSGITDMSLVQVTKAALPCLSILLRVTYIPQISLFLPNLIID